MIRKGHILANLGQFKDETPLNIMQIYSFLSVKLPKKIQKGHFMQTPHTVVSKISPALVASLLGNLLTGKGVLLVGEGTIRAAHGF